MIVESHEIEREISQDSSRPVMLYALETHNVGHVRGKKFKKRV